jgi:hypothetical protein
MLMSVERAYMLVVDSRDDPVTPMLTLTFALLRLEVGSPDLFSHYKKELVVLGR